MDPMPVSRIILDVRNIAKVAVLLRRVSLPNQFSPNSDAICLSLAELVIRRIMRYASAACSGLGSGPPLRGTMSVGSTVRVFRGGGMK